MGLKKDANEIQERIKDINTSEFRDIENQISSISLNLKEDRGELEKILENTGANQNELSSIKIKIKQFLEEEKIFRQKFDSLIDEHRALKDQFDLYYLERTDGKELEDVKFNFERNRKGNETKIENCGKDLIKLKSRYNQDHNTYLPVDDESLSFRELLKKYSDTELPSYLEKIGKARQDAEKEFKEHFVTRLNEYIEEARQSFNEINHTLKMILFGHDQYRFTIEERQDKKKIHGVIKTAAEIAENSGTLWEQFSTDEDRETVDHLFNNILENELDSPEVKDLCDYREYFNYDIKITHNDSIDEITNKPHVSSLSRVLKDKSGGEAQTPYYVAIAASFYRFFKDEDSAIRLVLFDEAFNKMDDDRIGKTIEFFRKLGIQIVTAVPTEKIEPIAPYMDQTNLVVRHNHIAYIRDYEVISEESAPVN